MGQRCKLEKRKKNRVTIKKMRQTVIERYKRLKGCYLCGFKEHPTALEFAHIDRKTKIDNVSSILYSNSWKKILEEIKKCRVMCANCHRVATFKELGYRRGVLHHKDDNIEYHTKLTDLFKNETSI
jgi:TPP-dependent indolepyruvate ferredoxin oxidoreductase alpha subunit